MITDMNPNDIVGETSEHVIELYGIGPRKVLVTAKEAPYPDGRLIVSRTDTKGIITHVNRSFVEMSGYSEAELVGTAHSILRHPDMPKAAFQDLWDTVKEGKIWQGHVKNLCKDGGYYWVKATVIPNIRAGRIVGYTSVRRKPDRRRVEECIPLYASMRTAEQEGSK